MLLLIPKGGVMGATVEGQVMHYSDILETAFRAGINSFTLSMSADTMHTFGNTINISSIHILHIRVLTLN